VSRLEELDAYVAGEMNAADADAFEEALFDAPGDADVEVLDRIARHGRQLVEHGTWDMGVTKAHVDQLIAAGHDIHVQDVGTPGTYTVMFDRRAELMLTILRLARTDLSRVDVELTLLDYNVTKTIKDALVDDGALYGLCERRLAEMAFGAGRTIARVRRTDGAREVIAQWELNAKVI
jgi:hypothetical protein